MNFSESRPFGPFVSHDASLPQKVEAGFQWATWLYSAGEAQRAQWHLLQIAIAVEEHSSRNPGEKFDDLASLRHVDSAELLGLIGSLRANPPPPSQTNTVPHPVMAAPMDRQQGVKPPPSMMFSPPVGIRQQPIPSYYSAIETLPAGTHLAVNSLALPSPPPPQYMSATLAPMQYQRKTDSPPGAPTIKNSSAVVHRPHEDSSTSSSSEGEEEEKAFEKRRSNIASYQQQQLQKNTSVVRYTFDSGHMVQQTPQPAVDEEPISSTTVAMEAPTVKFGDASSKALHLTPKGVEGLMEATLEHDDHSRQSKDDKTSPSRSSLRHNGEKRTRFSAIVEEEEDDVHHQHMTEGEPVAKKPKYEATGFPDLSASALRSPIPCNAGNFPLCVVSTTIQRDRSGELKRSYEYTRVATSPAATSLTPPPQLKLVSSSSPEAPLPTDVLRGENIVQEASSGGKRSPRDHGRVVDVPSLGTSVQLPLREPPSRHKSDMQSQNVVWATSTTMLSSTDIQSKWAEYKQQTEKDIGDADSKKGTQLNAGGRKQPPSSFSAASSSRKEVVKEATKSKFGLVAMKEKASVVPPVPQKEKTGKAPKDSEPPISSDQKKKNSKRNTAQVEEGEEAVRGAEPVEYKPVLFGTPSRADVAKKTTTVTPPPKGSSSQKTSTAKKKGKSGKK